MLRQCNGVQPVESTATVGFDYEDISTQSQFVVVAVQEMPLTAHDRSDMYQLVEIEPTTPFTWRPCTVCLSKQSDKNMESIYITKSESEINKNILELTSSVKPPNTDHNVIMIRRQDDIDVLTGITSFDKATDE